MKLLMHFFAVVALLGLGTPAAAAEYPDRTITFIVPSVAGGALDTFARSLAEEMGKGLRQTIIVENKAGASGMLGAQVVARSQPDGYTVLIVQSSALLNAPLLQAKPPFDPHRDFTFISQLSTGPYVLAVNTQVPARTMGEFLTWAAQNKGRVSYGSYAVGGFAHLVGAYLSHSKKLDMVHVPYKGEGPMVQDLASGQVTWAIGSMGTLRPQIDGGRVRALAVFSDRRIPEHPEIPTMTEVGLVEPAYKPIGWIGMLSAAKTPLAITERLNAEARTAMNSPRMQGVLKRNGGRAIGNSPAEFMKDFEDSVPVMKELIAITGAKAD